MNTAVYEMAPDIPERLRKRGDEILGHGMTNSEEQGHLSEERFLEIDAQVAAEVERAVAFAEAGSWEPVEDLTKDVYAP